MRCFVIIANPEDKDGHEHLSVKIGEVFENKYKLNGMAGWIVSHPQKTTTVQIVEAIKTKEDVHNHTWIAVFRITTYAGYYDGGLWESLSTWGDDK